MGQSECEVLARIALMTGAGFGLRDIAARVSIDTGMRIDEELVQILQSEVGLVKATPRQEVQARLIALGESQAEARRLADMIWETPAAAGIELARRGLLARGGKLLAGIPRSVAAVCKAGAGLQLAAEGKVVLPVVRLRELMAEAGVDQAGLQELFPGGSQALKAATMKLNLPRNSKVNPFRQTTAKGA